MGEHGVSPLHPCSGESNVLFCRCAYLKAIDSVAFSVVCRFPNHFINCGFTGFFQMLLGPFLFVCACVCVCVCVCVMLC
jgi:hypothetical protein